MPAIQALAVADELGRGLRRELARGPFARDYAVMLRAQRLMYRVSGIAAASGSHTAMARLHRGRWRKVAHSLIRKRWLDVVCNSPRLPRLLENGWGYWT